MIFAAAFGWIVVLTSIVPLTREQAGSELLGTGRWQDFRASCLFTGFFAKGLKPYARKGFRVKMTKDDVLAFRVGQQVHLLRTRKNATIAKREEILDADGTQVVGVRLVF
jgi:hypothetical protein